MMEALYSGVFWLARVLVLLFVIMTGLAACHVAFLSFMPMGYWVDYQSIDMILEPGRPERVKVTRTASDIIPIVRFVELHEKHEDGVVEQHCQSVEWTTAEPTTNPYVIVPLSTYVGDKCDLNALEGKSVWLQAAYVIDLSYNIRKQRAFYTGPFIVRQGQFIQPLRETSESSDSLPVRNLPVITKSAYDPLTPDNPANPE